MIYFFINFVDFIEVRGFGWGEIILLYIDIYNIILIINSIIDIFIIKFIY